MHDALTLLHTEGLAAILTQSIYETVPADYITGGQSVRVYEGIRLFQGRVFSITPKDGSYMGRITGRGQHTLEASFETPTDAALWILDQMRELSPNAR